MSNVDHPKHYNSHPSGVECIDIIEHMTFNTGNTIKYLWRAGLKDEDPTKHLEDLKKAAWYANREVMRIEKLMNPKMEVKMEVTPAMLTAGKIAKALTAEITKAQKDKRNRI